MKKSLTNLKRFKNDTRSEQQVQNLRFIMINIQKKLIYWKFGDGRQPFVECSCTAMYTLRSLMGNKSVLNLKKKTNRRLLVCRTVSDSTRDFFGSLLLS